MHILPYMNKNKITFYTCITIVNDKFVYLMYGIFNTENRNNLTIPPGTNPQVPFTFFFYFVSFLLPNDSFFISAAPTMIYAMFRISISIPCAARNDITVYTFIVRIGAHPRNS